MGVELGLRVRLGALVEWNGMDCGDGNYVILRHWT